MEVVAAIAVVTQYHGVLLALSVADVTGGILVGVVPIGWVAVGVIFDGSAWLEEPELEEEVVGERGYHRHGLRDPFASVFSKDVRGVVSQDDPCLF